MPGRIAKPQSRGRKINGQHPSTYLRIVASIVPKETLARLEVSGEVQIETRAQEILNAYRLIGSEIEDAEIIDE